MLGFECLQQSNGVAWERTDSSGCWYISPRKGKDGCVELCHTSRPLGLPAPIGRLASQGEALLCAAFLIEPQLQPSETAEQIACANGFEPYIEKKLWKKEAEQRTFLLSQQPAYAGLSESVKNGWRHIGSLGSDLAFPPERHWVLHLTVDRFLAIANQALLSMLDARIAQKAPRKPLDIDGATSLLRSWKLAV